MPSLRNDQLPRVCRLMCGSAGLSGYWTWNGPTPRAQQALRSRGGTLRRGQVAALRLAWDLWNGRTPVGVAALLHDLEPGSLSVLGSLFAALSAGPAQVDRFLDRHDPAFPASEAPALPDTPDDGYGDRDDSHAAGAWRRAP